MTEFKLTIQRFKILPNGFVSPFSWLFVASELIVVAFVILGGTLLWLGLAFATLLLSAFSAALISVLVRKIQTSCNCFGSSEKLVSPYDVGRNAVFIICAFAGLWLHSRIDSDLAYPNLPEVGLIGLTAAAFVLIVINFNEIVQIFK